HNTVYNASSTGIAKKYYVKKRGYKISIADVSDGRQVIDIIPPRPELLVSEGESIKLDQPLTSNPNFFVLKKKQFEKIVNFETSIVALARVDFYNNRKPLR
ncbi:hypothetical protein ACJX0J_032911, partial [Zea mays]